MTSRTGKRSATQDTRYRFDVQPADAGAIRAIVAATGMFTDAECDIARELVEERLARGDASGYAFVIADRAGQVAGYTAYGQIPCTQSSFDLYWIAVRPDCQGSGVGRELMRETERRIAAAGGERVYVDTSGRAAYAPTRAFYERLGYARAAELPDFYARGDAKVIYVKRLPCTAPERA